MRRLFFLLGWVASVSLFAPEARACFCPSSPTTVAAEVAASQAVFEGRVVETSLADGVVTARMLVLRAWKGASAGAEVEVHTRPGPSDCGYAFPVGTRHLVYADGGLWTSECSPTHAGTDVEELRALGPPQGVVSASLVAPPEETLEVGDACASATLPLAGTDAVDAVFLGSVVGYRSHRRGEYTLQVDVKAAWKGIPRGTRRVSVRGRFARTVFPGPVLVLASRPRDDPDPASPWRCDAAQFWYEGMGGADFAAGVMHALGPVAPAEAEGGASSAPPGYPRPLHPARSIAPRGGCAGCATAPESQPPRALFVGWLGVLAALLRRAWRR